VALSIPRWKCRVLDAESVNDNAGKTVAEQRRLIARSDVEQPDRPVQIELGDRLGDPGD
jgi:hypothetical protein